MGIDSSCFHHLHSTGNGRSSKQAILGIQCLLHFPSHRALRSKIPHTTQDASHTRSCLAGLSGGTGYLVSLTRNPTVSGEAIDWSRVTTVGLVLRPPSKIRAPAAASPPQWPVLGVTPRLGNFHSSATSTWYPGCRSTPDFYASDDTLHCPLRPPSSSACVDRHNHTVQAHHAFRP